MSEKTNQGDSYGRDRRIYVVGSSTGYANWMEGSLVKTMEEANLVVFTGGEDICPLIYDETDINPHTYYNLNRDDVEVKAYNKALSLNKKMIGICRGHQLLSALNGAKLIQDQPNPGPHIMKTYQGISFTINSLHHQAVFPFNLHPSEYFILGYTEDMLEYHHNGKRQEMNPVVEVEMIYFPKTQCLGIQCHPEMMKYSNSVIYERALNFFNMQLNRFMSDNIYVIESENLALKTKCLS